ncbi:MAG: hypothetical protein EXQ59_05220 [Acidobacteria bacterium]|nr:hypothetical protein [Acidobacteriota bacterium]
MFDVVGVGANSVDYVYRLPQFPQPDSSAAKLRITSHVISCGGQTTTALCTCAVMGLTTKYVGTTGSDANGQRMRNELSQRGVNIEHVYVRDTVNPFAVILLDEEAGERVVLWDRTPAMRLNPSEIDASLLRGARLLHVDDVDEDAALGAATIGRGLGVPVTSDIERVSDRTEELVAAVTIPIFAEHALAPLTGERDHERALRRVQKMAGPEGPALQVKGRPGPFGPGAICCVTLGSRGAMLLAGDRLHHEPGIRIQVHDTTGAGDVFRGAFITALLRGDTPADMLRFAVAAAAISCTRAGAIDSVPTLDETSRFLRDQDSTTKRTKISTNTT